MSNTYWIRAADLAHAAIGPFPTREAAEEHIAFCVARGDSAEHSIHDSYPDDVHFDMGPEEDRGYMAPCFNTGCVNFCEPGTVGYCIECLKRGI